MSNSVLWDDSNADRDRELLQAIVEKAIAGSEVHKERCVKKILKAIATPEWQKQYTHRHFVFCVYYAMGIEMLEIRLALSAQSIEALFFMISQRTNGSFAEKVQYIYRRFYQRDMFSNAAEAINILRNNTMHTGSIFGIKASMEIKDKLALKSFCSEYRHLITQTMADKQILAGLTAAFSLLVTDITLRVLGLNERDLTSGNTPPSRLNYFDRTKQTRKVR